MSIQFNQITFCKTVAQRCVEHSVSAYLSRKTERMSVLALHLKLFIDYIKDFHDQVFDPDDWP